MFEIAPGESNRCSITYDVTKVTARIIDLILVRVYSNSMNKESTFRVHCNFCDSIIESDNPGLFDNRYNYCAMCELDALCQDSAFAWAFFDRNVNPNIMSEV